MSPGSETSGEDNRPVVRDAEWLLALRARFVVVARRRVPPADVEDIVQEAMRVVVEKRIAPGAADVEGLPSLAWCFTVLRHCVGNYYQRRRTRVRHHAPLEAAAAAASPGPAPLESLESSDAEARIRAAIAEIAHASASCGRYLNALADGRAPAEIARDESLEEAVLYRRVYRCRQQLRALLLARGVLA